MFNDKYGLTKAVLEGRKTMTRRIVPGYDGKTIPYGGIDGSKHFVIANKDRFFTSVYAIGEVVAVAQSYESVLKERGGVKTIAVEVNAGFRNKMFVVAAYMPHQIRITNIRVERLQDISDNDCEREGLEWINRSPGIYKRWTFKGVSCDYETRREAFAALIDKVSGKGTWESNPWVFVYEFELVK